MLVDPTYLLNLLRQIAFFSICLEKNKTYSSLHILIVAMLSRKAIIFISVYLDFFPLYFFAFLVCFFFLSIYSFSFLILSFFNFWCIIHYFFSFYLLSMLSFPGSIFLPKLILPYFIFYTVSLNSIPFLSLSFTR